MNPIHKHLFIPHGVGALTAAPSMALAVSRQLAAMHAGLSDMSDMQSWQTFEGERFLVGGQPVVLEAVEAVPGPGGQFSLRFAAMDGGRPAGGLLPVRHASGTVQLLHLQETPTGLRADFARTHD